MTPRAWALWQRLAFDPAPLGEDSVPGFWFGMLRDCRRSPGNASTPGYGRHTDGASRTRRRNPMGS